MSIIDQLMTEKQNLELQLQQLQLRLTKVVDTINAYQGESQQEQPQAQQEYNEPPQAAITPDEVIAPEPVAPESVTDDFLDQLRQG